MNENKDFKTVLKKNRRILLAILMLPVIGMLIAIPLIMWKAPQSLLVAGGVIAFLLVQYLLLVWWISKKIEQIIKS
jgi:hypothetical protein